MMRWMVVACLALAGCGPLPCLTDYCEAVRAGQIAPPPFQAMPVQTYQPAPIQLGPRSVTNCSQYGNSVSCSTY